MSNTNDADLCDVCNRGIVVRKSRKSRSRQRTIKGCVSYRIIVPVAACAECGARSWDEPQAIVAEAVRLEAEKLP
jgi:hypothetical protein